MDRGCVRNINLIDMVNVIVYKAWIIQRIV